MEILLFFFFWSIASVCSTIQSYHANAIECLLVHRNLFYMWCIFFFPLLTDFFFIIIITVLLEVSPIFVSRVRQVSYVAKVSGWAGGSNMLGYVHFVCEWHCVEYVCVFVCVSQYVKFFLWTWSCLYSLHHCQKVLYEPDHHHHKSVDLN